MNTGVNSNQFEVVENQETLILQDSPLKSKIFESNDKIALMEEIQRKTPKEWQEMIEEARRDPSVLAFLSLYPNFWRPDQREPFFRMLKETEGERKTRLPYPLENKPAQELKIILPQIAVAQLSYGCTGACEFCDVAAPFPRVDGENTLEHLTLDQIKNLSEEYKKTSQRIKTALIHWASDPLDNPEIAGILEELRMVIWREFGFVTHLPKDGIPMLPDVLKTNVTFEISVTNNNLKRVKEAVRTELREKIKNCFDLPSEMPKDGSEDTRIRVDGAFIRTFGTTPKIHTLGKAMMQRRHPENKSGKGCRTGAMLTPLGLFNKIEQVVPDDHYPFGDIISPVETLEKLDAKQYIDAPVEKLLRHTVVANFGDNKYPKHRNTSVSFVVIDAENQDYFVLIKRQDKRWIIERIEKL